MDKNVVLDTVVSIIKDKGGLKLSEVNEIIATVTLQRGDNNVLIEELISSGQVIELLYQLPGATSSSSILFPAGTNIIASLSNSKVSLVKQETVSA